MRARSLIAIGVLIAAVLATAVAPSSGRSQTPGIYIALGDSVAFGIGSSLPRTRSYTAVLHGWMERWAGAPVVFANLARSGESTRAFIDEGQLAEFREEVQLARQSEIPVLAVTVTLGGNDILEVQDAGVADRSQALEQFRSDFPEAIAQVREVIGEGVPLAVTTYYDPTGGDPALPNTDSWWIARFNEVIAEAAAAQGALVVDLAGAFADAEGELTRYPVDVHPTNIGHLAIARAVWEALAIDEEPPQVEAQAPPPTSRRTPTISFRVADNVAVRSLSLEISGGEVSEPIPIDDGQYVALVDVRETQGERFDVTISAMDEAGNRSVETITVKILE